MSLGYCPRCRQDFDTPDQMVCGHCGYRLGGRGPAVDPGPAVGANWLWEEGSTEEGSTEGRPTGVTFLAVLYAIIGGLALVGGAVLVAVPDAVDALIQQPSQSLTDQVIGAVGVASGIASLVFAFGAWYLERWARVLGIVVIGAAMVSSIVEAANAGSAIGTLVIGGAMIWYLRQPHVKAAFGVTDTSETDAREGHIPLGLFRYLERPRVTKAFEVTDASEDRAHPAVGSGLIAGIALVVLYIAGLGSLYAWGLSDYMAKPLAPAPPGSVADICFSDSMMDCDLSSTAPLDPHHLAYRFSEGIFTHLDLVIFRIEGDRERKVLVVDMNRSTLWFGNAPRGVGMFGPFSCNPCGESAPYMGRVLDGTRLVAEGFFRT
jgi:hypothetical protein